MDTDYKKAANITVIAAGALIFVWIFLKYVSGALMPFILAAAISSLVSPLAERISTGTRIPRKLSCAVILIIIFAGISALIYMAVSRLVFEIGKLLEYVSSDPEALITAIQGFMDKLTGNGSRFAFIQKIFEIEAFKELGIDINEILKNALSSMLSSLSSALPGAAVSLISKIPAALLFTVVFLISAFYFSFDMRGISAGLKSFLPSKWQKKLPLVKRKLTSTLSGYLKAYLLIMLITFLEMFVGLSLLKVNYAFIIAAIIAVVDILPVLGTGTVLVPWAVFCFIASDPTRGIYLLILYAISLVIRQFAEPKIVGTTLGIHPLATLASVYIGLRFLGVAGIFIGPMVALILKELLFSRSHSEALSEQKDKTPSPNEEDGTTDGI